MSKPKCRVAAIQLDCAGSYDEVRERSRAMIIEACMSSGGADIVCLPEHWIPGANPNIEDEIPFFAGLAVETGSHVILGADYGRVTGNRKAPHGATSGTRVEGIILGPKGRVVGRQQKVHLFGTEKAMASPGSGFSVFDLDGVIVGMAICHDLVYPEVARVLALKGAEIVFAPAKIGASGLGPWRLYVKVRALENRIPIVTPNVMIDERFPGGSLIMGFSFLDEEKIVYPRVLARASSTPKVVVADLDLERIGPYRRERLEARRTGAYSELLKK